jgi:glycosyltransferase involved in cell wall biosynthesis
MQIGIHLTTFNRQEFTKQCILSLLWSKPKNSKIVVVDNNSTDGTVEYLKDLEKSEPLVEKVIYNNENKHLGYAVNQGWEILSESCDILLWQNNDFLFEPNWEQNVINCFQDLNLDVIVGTVRPDREASRIVTKNGGTYTKGRDVGAAYFVTTEQYKKGIVPSARKFEKGYVGPGPQFHKRIKKLHFVRLAHPGILVRDSEYNKEEYVKYYNNTMGIRGREGKLAKWRRMDKNGNPRGWCNWETFLEKYYPDKI